MPDLQVFDSVGFFNQKVSENEQNLIGKKAELEILFANRRNLESAIMTLALLDSEYQHSIQPEFASLKEVLATTVRSIAGLTVEIDLLTNKLAALQAARDLLQVEESP